MSKPHKRSWVLLTSFAGCVALATTVEPGTWMQLAQASDVQHESELQPENAQCAYLIKLLERSTQFRVRAQAAISLGMMDKSTAAREALTAALRDAHPAVRAAAATSLGRIGGASHVVALRQLGDDPEAPVRNAARTSIGRIESMNPIVLETRATTAALSPTTNTNRL